MLFQAAYVRTFRFRHLHRKMDTVDLIAE